MYKLIACDLDETLLADDTSICERNKKDIAKAIDKGVKFVPATGRGYNAIQSTLKELNLANKVGEYVISFNGGCISENYNNQVLHYVGLTSQKAEALFQTGRHYHVCMHVYTKERVYLYHADQDEVNYVKKRHPYEIINNQTDLSFLHGQDIPKLLFANTDVSYLERIADEIHNLTSDLDVSYSSNRYLEFNHAGINKGNGLLWLAKKLKIKPEETMALGDNLNDLSMIKAAGLGVGMQNTVEKMKADCDYVTQADNNEGGVGEAIERFILESDK